MLRNNPGRVKKEAGENASLRGEVGAEGGEFSQQFADVAIVLVLSVATCVVQGNSHPITLALLS